MRWRSYIFVVVQFGCLGGIAVSGPWVARHWVLCVLEFLGVALGGWALGTMSRRSLTAFPDVKEGGELVTRGPYRVIRHPMYAALLLVTLSLVLDAWSIGRLGMWLLLFCDLFMKLSYEEMLLCRHFQDYPEYQRRTTRLIPFVF